MRLLGDVKYGDNYAFPCRVDKFPMYTYSPDAFRNEVFNNDERFKVLIGDVPQPFSCAQMLGNLGIAR